MTGDSAKESVYRMMLIITLALFSAFLVTLLVDRLYRLPPSAHPVQSSWEMKTAAGTSRSRGSVYLLRSEENGIPEGEITIRGSFRIDNDIRRPLLIIPAITGNGIRITMDGTYIGTAGDMSRGRSSIWGSSHVFPLPFPLPQGEHLLEIDFLILYEAGILIPPYLVEQEKVPLRTMILLFYNNGFLNITTGILFILGIFFIITGALTLPGGWGKLGVGAAQLLVMIFLLDYGRIRLLPIPYLAWKTIANMAMHLAIAILVPSLQFLFGKKPGKGAWFLSLFEVIVAMALLLLPDNVLELRQLYTIFHSTIFIAILYLIISGFTLINRERSLTILYTGFLFAMILGARDVIGLISEEGDIFYSHLGILGFMLTAGVAVSMDILKQYRIISLERQRADHLYERSMKDPLTGAFNRNILQSPDLPLDKGYVLILFDLDDFKQINDTRGHAAGDLVLQHLVEAIKENTRTGDIIIRQGGDEFALILPSCTLQRASTIAEAIDRTIQSTPVLEEDPSFRYTASAGIALSNGNALEELFQEADQELYRNKERRRRNAKTEG